MIDFIRGKISVGERSISVATTFEEINELAKENLIEIRKTAVQIYYYLEVETDGMRFGVFISLTNKKIKWLLLRWLDRPMKSWDDVSEKAMIDEYRLISNLVEKKIGAAPDKKKTGTRLWRLKWGEVDVSYEIRSCDVAIFMTPP